MRRFTRATTSQLPRARVPRFACVIGDDWEIITICKGSVDCNLSLVTANRVRAVSKYLLVTYVSWIQSRFVSEKYLLLDSALLT